MFVNKNGVMLLISIRLVVSWVSRCVFKFTGGQGSAVHHAGSKHANMLVVANDWLSAWLIMGPAEE